MIGLLTAFRFYAGLLGLSAVALGAIAAHALQNPQAAIAVERAATYQLMHAVILVVATCICGRAAKIAQWLFLTGTIIFCGSIYVKYFLNIVEATKIAPLGGIILMLGWLSLALSAKHNAK